MLACGWAVAGNSYEFTPEDKNYKSLRDAIAWTEALEKDPGAWFSCVWCKKKLPKKGLMTHQFLVLTHLRYLDHLPRQSLLSALC